jgi:hypothetical protein
VHDSENFEKFTSHFGKNLFLPNGKNEQPCNEPDDNEDGKQEITCLLIV